MYIGQNDSNEDESDEQLMIAYQKGNFEAFGTLYLRYEEYLYNFFLKWVGDREQANDLLQEQRQQILPYMLTVVAHVAYGIILGMLVYMWLKPKKLNGFCLFCELHHKYFTDSFFVQISEGLIPRRLRRSR